MTYAVFQRAQYLIEFLGNNNFHDLTGYLREIGYR